MKVRKKTKKLLLQVAEYMMAGGAWFWSAYIIILVLTPVIGLWWSNIVGNGVGLTINFLLERNWVFSGSKKRKTTDVTWKYVVFTAMNFLLSYLILKTLKDHGIELYIGQFISAAIFTVWNYLWYKYWVFKETAHPTRIRHHV